MARKILPEKLLSIALVFLLLVGLSPMSNHMLSMQMVSMDAAMDSQSYTVPADAGDPAHDSCCDAMGTSSLGCDFMVSQSACAALYGGGERVANLTPVIQTIYIKAVPPPPKA